MPKLAPWRVDKSVITYQDRWLTVRSDDCVTADGQRVAPYHVLEYPNWISVAPFTADGRLVLVREYRHGAGKIVTGLVSGAVDPADGAGRADPAEAAARRELAEEIGFTGGAWRKVLTCYANPANQNNLATVFLALDVEHTVEPVHDSAEVVELVWADFGETLRGLSSGEVMMQAIHVAALWATLAHMLASPEPRLQAMARAALA